MRIVAILTARNEALQLPRCLTHLAQNGIETIVIDNGSTDETREVAESFVGRGVVAVQDLAFGGDFDLTGVLENEMRIAQTIDADWLMHVDADEIMETPWRGVTLRDGIQVAHDDGTDAINFDEFVFLPTTEEENFEAPDYVEAMTRYYFYEPIKLRQIRAIRRRVLATIELVPHAALSRSADLRVFSQSFVLRHYIALSRPHAVRKYTTRSYSARDLERSFHAPRVGFTEDRLRFPDAAALKTHSAQVSCWDTSDPWQLHSFLVGLPHGRRT